MTRDDSLVDALLSDPLSAPVEPTEQVALEYAIKLTRAPSAMEALDVEALREAGFEDRAIFDINHVTAYYNYVNRIADGLGVELESFWQDEE